MTTRPGGVVHRLDLRHEGGREARQRVTALLTEPPAGLTGLLVVDDVDELFEHEEAYEQITGSAQIATLVVAAVGTLPADRTLEIPQAIHAGEGSVLLWIADPVGVTWQPSARTAVRVTAPDRQQALDPLIAVLEAPEVHRALCGLPGIAVASAGLHLLGQDGGPAQALARTVGALASGTDTSRTEGEAAAEALRAVRSAVEVSTAEGVILDDGPLGRAVEALRRQVRHVLGETDRLGQRSGLLRARDRVTRIRADIARIGAGLGEYRLSAQRLGEGTMTLGGGTNLAEIDRLRAHYGLRTLAGSPAPDPALAGHLDGVVTRWLEEGAALPQVERRLSHVERQIRPRTRAEHLARVDQACPEPLPAALASPPPFPPPPPWLLAAGALLGLGSAVHPALGPVGAGAAVLLGTGVTGCWPVMRRGVRALTVLAGAAAVAVGGAAGLAAGRSLVVPGWAALAAFVLAGMVTPVLVVLGWTTTSRRWVRQLALDRAAAAEEEITGLVEDLVRSEWSTLEGRSRATDLLIRVRAMMAGAQQALDGVTARQPGPPAPTATSDAAREYWHAVVDGYARSLLLDTLEPGWDQVVTQPPQALQDGMHDAVFGAFIGWTASARSGAWRLPPEVRPRPGATRGVGPDAVQYLVSAVTQPVDAPMRQLVGPDDVRVLDSRPEAMAGVRFCPGALPAPAAELLPVGTVLTHGPLLAGVLRLVPLRAGTVRPRWRAAGPAIGPAIDLVGGQSEAEVTP